MKVLVVGNGGREHAIAWKLSQSASVDRIFATQPNAGMSSIVEGISIAPTDIEGLVRFAKSEGVDLTVPGPEAPLCAGIVDAFEEQGLFAFGPNAACAKMEGSKAFAKDVMARMGVPTAEYSVFHDFDSARAYVEGCQLPVVVKADGLAAGKGVRICGTRDEAVAAVQDMMGDQLYGVAGARLVVEEFLEGRELSFMALVDGSKIVPLATSQDHKRLLDNDLGPNTGGMGAFSPSPIADEALIDRVMHEVMHPTIASLDEQGLRYRGFLYAGLMVSERGPSTLEFNVRLGDPETQPLLFRLKSDLATMLLSARDGFSGLKVEWDPRPAVCLVLASEGYPVRPIKGRVISGLDDVSAMDDVMVFHAGTRFNDQGEVITSGGRVLGVTALGDSLAQARVKAYSAVKKIHFEGQHVRADIALSV